MADSIFQLIDQTALKIRADLDLVAASIDGVYTRMYREDPSTRGLQRFMQQTSDTSDTAARLAASHLEQFRNAMLNTTIDPLAGGKAETLTIALQQLRTTIESLRLLAARRFSAALVSRSSIAPPLAGSLRVMNRAGQQHRASEQFLLMGRKAAIDLYNEAQIETLRFQGFQVAVIGTRDPESDLNGARLLIGDAELDLPRYADVQDKWFHPRSNAVIERGE